MALPLLFRMRPTAWCPAPLGRTVRCRPLHGTRMTLAGSIIFGARLPAKSITGISGKLLAWAAVDQSEELSANTTASGPYTCQTRPSQSGAWPRLPYRKQQLPHIISTFAVTRAPENTSYPAGVALASGKYEANRTLSSCQRGKPTHIAETLETVLCEHSSEHAAAQCQVGCNSLDRHVLLHATAATRFLTRCVHTSPSESQSASFGGLRGYARTADSLHWEVEDLHTVGRRRCVLWQGAGGHDDGNLLQPHPSGMCWLGRAAAQDPACHHQGQTPGGQQPQPSSSGDSQ
jgi:hypothetical protein